MSDDRSMSVKAYLDVGDGRQEVRRFGMPEDLATNFSCLKEKICNVFALGRKDVTLTWKDSEGDAVVISSDEELVEAIADSMSKQKLQVFRVFISPGARASSGPDKDVPGNQQGEVHDGVVCDVCEGPVVGFRYRCVSCYDFDLCGACETKGLHREHKIIRSPKPRAPGEPNFWWKEEHGPGHFGAHFGMHGGAGGNTYSCSSSTSTGATAGATAGAGPNGAEWHSWGPWGGRGRRCGRRGRGFGGWGGLWGKSYGGEGGSGGGGCWKGQGQTLGEKSGQQQKQQETQQEQPQQNQQSQQQQQRSSSCDNDNGCPFSSNRSCPFGEGAFPPPPPMPDPERIAEEVQFAAQEASKMAHHFASQIASEQVANVMRGIWTAWSGQQPPAAGPSVPGAQTAPSVPGAQTAPSVPDAQTGPSTSASTSTNQQQEANIDSLGIDDEVPRNNGIRQRCSLSEDDIQSRQSPTVQMQGSSTPTPSAAPRSIGVQSEGSEESVAEMEVCSPPEAVNPMESDVEDWTLVNRDSQSPEGRPQNQPSTSAAEQRAQYPSLTELQPHPNPVIQQSLEQMQSMGYNNEGGWLTNLLEMKQGDINQVLDLLQPVNK